MRLDERDVRLPRRGEAVHRPGLDSGLLGCWFYSVEGRVLVELIPWGLLGIASHRTGVRLWKRGNIAWMTP